MEMYRFTRKKGKTVEAYESHFTINAVGKLDSDSHIAFMSLSEEDAVGRHEAPVSQLFYVMEGSGWVTGEDDRKRPIHAAEAAFWKKGEAHSAGTDTFMKVLVIESEALKPEQFMAIKMEEKAEPLSIELAPMTEEEFSDYLEQTIRSYAYEHFKAGTWTKEEAEQKSREEHMQLLPKGLSTPNQLLFTLKYDGSSIGILWINIHRKGADKQAFIYDIELEEDMRGRGLGKSVMAALDNYARNNGIKKMALHVFAHNYQALTLYKECGYDFTNYHMAKMY